MHPLVFFILCVLLITIVLVLLTLFSTVTYQPQQSLVDTIYVSFFAMGFIGLISSSLITFIITGIYVLIKSLFKKSIYVSKIMALFMFILSLILTFALVVIWASIIGSSV